MDTDTPVSTRHTLRRQWSRYMVRDPSTTVLTQLRWDKLDKRGKEMTDEMLESTKHEPYYDQELLMLVDTATRRLSYWTWYPRSYYWALCELLPQHAGINNPFLDRMHDFQDFHRWHNFLHNAIDPQSPHAVTPSAYQYMTLGTYESSVIRPAPSVLIR